MPFLSPGLSTFGQMNCAVWISTDQHGSQTMLFVLPFSQMNPSSDTVTGSFVSAVLLPCGLALELLDIYHVISYVKEHTLLDYLAGGLSCISQDSNKSYCLFTFLKHLSL